ncbi:uncharacterized protein RHIMIDRAFT_235069 [Rhizopus microsporus ATCC 52813]|uniref:Uncharacterized protein n=1 Tax=Rhizopus microsporus ATCC 52813 TaxID=1340429 RepID=A0A2G4T3X8_RHIZD|nr:uncharacterized protein RHIMIDRAFT_235069 [Rhizopus microsporus ATCC 52813]PHZ15731.1 hypothetical protein RHIMIDRAFT_235069 [Rhizopus microsporus ATCC 52813]
MINYEYTLACAKLNKIINIQKRFLWYTQHLNISFQLGEILPMGLQAAMLLIRVKQEAAIHRAFARHGHSKHLQVMDLHTSGIYEEEYFFYHIICEKDQAQAQEEHEDVVIENNYHSDDGMAVEDKEEEDNEMIAGVEEKEEMTTAVEKKEEMIVVIEERERRDGCIGRD